MILDFNIIFDTLLTSDYLRLFDYSCDGINITTSKDIIMRNLVNTPAEHLNRIAQYPS
jgi:hypothetical protein